MPVNEDVCMHAWVARQTLNMTLAKVTLSYGCLADIPKQILNSNSILHEFL